MANAIQPNSEGLTTPKTAASNLGGLSQIRNRTAILMDEKEAAQHLEVTSGTLSVWRSTGRYKLPFIKIGSKVRYRLSDLDAWLESRTRATGATA